MISALPRRVVAQTSHAAAPSGLETEADTIAQNEFKGFIGIGVIVGAHGEDVLVSASDDEVLIAQEQTRHVQTHPDLVEAEATVSDGAGGIEDPPNNVFGWHRINHQSTPGGCVSQVKYWPTLDPCEGWRVEVRVYREGSDQATIRPLCRYHDIGKFAQLGLA